MLIDELEGIVGDGAAEPAHHLHGIQVFSQSLIGADMTAFAFTAGINDALRHNVQIDTFAATEIRVCNDSKLIAGKRRVAGDCACGKVVHDGFRLGVAAFGDNSVVDGLHECLRRIPGFLCHVCTLVLALQNF